MSDEDEKEIHLFPPLSLIERRLIASPAASGFPSADELLFQHSVLCQASLPYRDPGEEMRLWERRNGTTHLKIMAGEAMHPVRRELVPIGLPFGPKPRLILSHLNAEALRTGKPEIDVEGTLTAFVKRLGLSSDGRSVRMVKDQLARLSASTVRLGVVAETEHGIETATVNMPIVHQFNLWFPKDDRQRVLWPSFVKLSSDYFESLQKHAVPLHPDALAALSHSAMGLDVYAWLAQRLHRIKPERPQFVTWKAIKEQFGWHYQAMFKFRQVFNVTLAQVLTQYPAARIEVDEGGLTLLHSPPPVLYRTSPVIRGSR